MEQENKMPMAQTVEKQSTMPDQLQKTSKNAVARERKRVEYEASTTARKCLGCGDEFRSEGAHHRMCNRCRSRR